VVPIKRLDLLFDALARARQQSPRLQLAVVGDGEMRPRLERVAVDLGVRDAIHFLGYRSDLVPIFAAADLAVISSDNEGTPVSLIEAGAAGLPAVATEVGGVAEVVSPETGVLVLPGDAEAFSEALARLAGDAQARSVMGAAARIRVPERYSAARLVDDIAALYEDLLAGGSVT
jgi:glycosyltransferase involved in cell wall biosynthesis